MPLTLQFGGWAPDLANDPVQIPDSQGPMPVQCADVLNIYFSNGSYKSVASPAPAIIGGVTSQALNAAAVNAYSFYDTVQQQQTVFAGTQVGVQQLNTDGSWLNVQFLTNQSAALTGQAMTISTGFLVNTKGLRVATMKFSTGKLLSGVFGLSFVAGAYDATGATEPGTPPIPAKHLRGYSPPTYGTCAHPGLLTGTMNKFFDDQVNKTTTLVISNVASDPTQSAFTTLKANNKTLLSSQASYLYSSYSNSAQWVWAGNIGFSSGATYRVVAT